MDQIDRNQDADFVFNLRRKSSQLPIGLDLLEDNTILPSQSSIKNQNAEIFNKVADLTITKELHVSNFLSFKFFTLFLQFCN